MSKKKKEKKKTDLGHKLFAVRKQMSVQQRSEWFDWFKGQRDGISEATFDAISRGDYISRENIRLAMEALKKGRSMLEELQSELSSI